MLINLKNVIGRQTYFISDDVDLAAYFRNRRILITGAGGSIGKALVLELHKLGVEDFYATDRDENALHSLQLMIGGAALFNDQRIKLCDIRDLKSCQNLLSDLQPDIIIHAAALKHLSALEYQEREAILTNVIGTAHMIQASNEAGVNQFVNISTDKAAAPTSILGLSKRIGEWLLQEYFTGPEYASVRFGNVFASRGSVIETFKYQLEHGHPVTLTHLEVERFFMSDEEAAFLVLKSASIQEKGVFVLDMGDSVKVMDVINGLSQLIGVPANVEITGLRPGEKLKEVVYSDTEKVTQTKFAEIKKIQESGNRSNTIAFTLESNFVYKDCTLEEMLSKLYSIGTHEAARAFFESVVVK